MHSRLIQDEKALTFFSTISQEWRLFWAIEAVGISFSLALVAIFIVGDSSQLVQSDGDGLEGYPSWMIWVVNPAVATMIAYHLSVNIETWCAAFHVLDPLNFQSVVARTSEGLSAAITQGRDFLREDKFFCAALIVWIVQGAISWWLSITLFGPPVAFSCYSEVWGSFRICMTENIWTLTFVNAMLGVGVVLKILGVGFSGQEVIVPIRGPWCSCAISCRSTSLLIGWGLGYWLTSVLHVFCASSLGGGWDEAPTIVRYVGYVVIVCFVLVSIFMMAEVSFLGTKFGRWIKPAIDIVIDKNSITYWVMVTVFRDALLLWGLSCLLVVRLF